MWNGLELPPAYYQDDAVYIIHADCREVLPLIPDNSIDLVLTDPPYGIDYQSAWRTECQRKPKIVGDGEFPLWLFSLVKPKCAYLVFCRWDTLVILPPPKSFIVWDKVIHGMGDLKHEYGRQWEGCAFYPQNGHKFNKRPVDVIRAMRISPDKLVHPNEKPAGAVSPLIAANEGNLILDPFLGSGTTAYCAKKLGRKCIGVEIEERYCRIAAQRCAQMVLPLESEQVKQGQGTSESLMFPRMASSTKSDKVRGKVSTSNILKETDRE